MTERGHGWLTAQTAKPRRVALSLLGQDALRKDGKPKRIPRSELQKGAELARHSTCVEHVELTGGGSPRTGLHPQGRRPRRGAGRRAPAGGAGRLT